MNTPYIPASVTAVAANDGEAIAGTSSTKMVVPANLPAAVPYHAGPVVNGRSPRQELVFDGTAGATVANVPAFGTGDFTAAAWVLPESFSTYKWIFHGATNSFALFIDTDGTVVASKAGVVDESKSTTALVAGKAAFVAYTRTGTTGTYYINGVACGTTTDNNDYTVPTTLIGGSANFWKGRVAPLLLNYCKSAAEVLRLFETGAPDASDYYGNAVHTAIFAGSFVFGKKYRIASAGTTDFTLIGAANSTVGTEFTATGVGTGTGTATALGLLLAPEAAAPGNGLVWNDASGNGAHIVLPATGVEWALPSNRANRIRGTTNTNGNQQLLAASTLIPANAQILRVRARSRSGTPSITIGTASGGSQIVASVALSTTWKDLTIALTGGIVSSADDIWIGSSSTDVVETDITWEPLSY